MLDKCLLTKDELTQDLDTWEQLYPDPFPKWETAMTAS